MLTHCYFSLLTQPALLPGTQFNDIFCFVLLANVLFVGLVSTTAS